MFGVGLSLGWFCVLFFVLGVFCGCFWVGLGVVLLLFSYWFVWVVLGGLFALFLGVKLFIGCRCFLFRGSA